MPYCELSHSNCELSFYELSQSVVNRLSLVMNSKAAIYVSHKMKQQLFNP